MRPSSDELKPPQATNHYNKILSDNPPTRLSFSMSAPVVYSVSDAGSWAELCGREATGAEVAHWPGVGGGASDSEHVGGGGKFGCGR
ncbi:hypothetical protein E2C01_013678 [Portunus trituberculatus]|uniref:Uncharacterized protein n=1 Tax=Portunus trituberculatus TaxID=210409 RepID=A0A5B7DHP0_PORTR|nr:hypothetical protein [Portunus trituberculatus]